MVKDRPVLIAGGGIAGLSAALALGAKDIPVRVFERSSESSELGAGLQISPNATRILARIGALDRLKLSATRPEAIELKSANTGRTVAIVQLGSSGEQRWGAPYLVARRADLHRALLEATRDNRRIELKHSASVVGAISRDSGISIELQRNGEAETIDGRLLIGADGVWSELRRQVRRSPESEFTGYIAWRSTVPTGEFAELGDMIGRNRVTAFLNSRFHLVAYPLRGDETVNLVAVTRGQSIVGQWSNRADLRQLGAALAGTRLAALAKLKAEWTTWPLYTVDPAGAWSDRRRLALVGDAAHAMTPFAAQGAAMAIEDGYVLAACLAGSESATIALQRYETLRKPRVNRVVRRSAFNRFTWHATGPIAIGRDVVLALRSAESLMRDFDWLYGFDPADTAIGG